MSKGNGNRPTLYDARGKRAQRAPQGVNFADQGWSVAIQDRNTIIAMHPSSPPIVLTSEGSVMQLEDNGDDTSTAFLMTPDYPEDDPTEQLMAELARDFGRWCRTKAGRLVTATSPRTEESGDERPASRPPSR